jgi:GR25 family glycosyltransferase involved in LPS biosynthesis
MIKIFVVHYSKLTDRKNHILRQFEKHGIHEFEFIEGFDKDDITDENCRQFDPEYIMNRRGELSLHLKHFYIYQMMVNEKIDEALIFEDDIILSDGFMEKLTEYMTQLPSNYDMLFLGDGCLLHIPSDQIVPGQYIYKKNVEMDKDGIGGATRCTDSYIIHNRCAQKICDYITNMKCNITLPIDWWLNIAARDNNLDVYWCEPTIVTQGSHPNNGLFPCSLK